MMRNSVLLVFILLLSYPAIAQDSRKIDFSIMASIAPVYSLSDDYIDFWSAPFGPTIQIFYNVNDRWSAGIHGQYTEFSGFTGNLDGVSESYFANAGFTGKFNITPHSRFKLYIGAILGLTLVTEDADVYSNSPLADKLERQVTYNENKFTAGAFLGLDIRLFKPLSINIQVSQQDIFGAFSDDYVIHVIHGETGLYNNDIYIPTGSGTAYTYVPFYTSAGLTFKFGKKKI